MSDLSQVTPPKELTEADRLVIFEHVFRRLAAHRNTAQFYAGAEYGLSAKPQAEKARMKEHFLVELNGWAQELVKHVWIACQEPGGGKLFHPSNLD